MPMGIVSMLLNGYSTNILDTFNSFIFNKLHYSSIKEIGVRKTSLINLIRLITIYIKLTQVFLFFLEYVLSIQANSILQGATPKPGCVGIAHSLLVFSQQC